MQKGRPALPGLPGFRDGAGVETLCVTLRDVFGLEVELRYTVYEAEDLITRSAVYKNAGEKPLTLHKAASLCLDFAPGCYDLITLNGTWAAERAECPATPTTPRPSSARPTPPRRQGSAGASPLCTAAIS